MTSQEAEILIVEDEAAHIELIKNAFLKKNQDITLQITRTIKEAYAYILNHKPDLVITDYLLPDGKGIDLLSMLKEPCPIILMTSHGDEKIAVEAMKSGALDYVPKSADLLSELPHIAERGLREWAHITERKKMGTRLKDEHDFTSAVLDTSGALVTVFDAKGKILRFNRACEYTTGYSSDEVINQSFFDLFISENEQNALKNAFKQLKQGKSHIEGENSFQHKNQFKILIA